MYVSSCMSHGDHPVISNDHDRLSRSYYDEYYLGPERLEFKCCYHHILSPVSLVSTMLNP